MNPYARSTRRLFMAAFVAAGLVLFTSPLQAVVHTWTLDSTGNQDWGTGANWDGNGVFASAAANDLVFYADTTTRLNIGTMDIINVPAAQTMGNLTFNGRGPNSTASFFVNIGDNSSTFTIGDGATGTVTQNAASGGGGDRFINYTLNPNITLNAPTVTFTGNGGGLLGLRFTGNIGDGGSGNGLTKSGNHLLVVEGTSTYTGTTTASGGSLRLASANALPGGTGATGGTSNLTLNGGVVELANGDFQRGVGTGSDQFQITGGNSGFSAFGASGNDRTIAVNGNPGTELVWGSATFNPGTFILNSSRADGKLILTNGIDLGGSSRNIQVNANTAEISGVIQGAGGGLNKSGSGDLQLTGANTYTGNTRMDSGTLSIERLDNIGVGGGLNFNGGTLEVRGTTLTSLSQVNAAHSITLNNNKNVGLDIDDRDNTFTADIALTPGSGTFTKAGPGTLILNQANTTGTGKTTVGGGGTLVLDYTAQDNAKISTGDLNSSGSEIILRGGTHAQTVNRIILSNGGGTTAIIRDGGTAALNLTSTINRTTREGANLTLSEDNIATTTSANNTYGILDGWATVGSNWAINDGGGNIVGLSTYTPVTGGGDAGSSTANLQLTGNQTRTTQLNGNTLRISNDGNSQTLDIGTNNLRISQPNGDGGLLYAGGANNNYTITGTTGTLNPLNGNQELIINTYTGTLTIDVQVLPGGSTSAPLSKNGTGTLVLSGTNNYVGNTYVNSGTLLINGDQSAATGDVIVHRATLGGTGTIGGAVTVSSAGVLAPGASPGDLTFAANLLINGQAAMEIGTTTIGNYDRILMTNGANIDISNASLSASNYLNSWNTSAWYPIIQLDPAGGLTGTFASLESIRDIDYNFDFMGGTWVAIQVPEPSTFGLLAMLGGGLLALRRRRG